MKETFENFIEKHWRGVVIVVALLYIGLGLFQALTGIELDPSKTRNVELVLMITALYVFFYGKRKEREKAEKEKEETEITDGDEAKPEEIQIIDENEVTDNKNE